jgi:hypothetical protein
MHHIAFGWLTLPEEEANTYKLQEFKRICEMCYKKIAF